MIFSFAAPLSSIEEIPIGLFLLKRLATFVLTLLAASAVIFTVLDVLPGNAAELRLGESATPEAMQALRLKLGLDRPPLERYASWVQGALHGALGGARGAARRLRAHRARQRPERAPDLVAACLPQCLRAGADGDGPAVR